MTLSTVTFQRTDRAARTAPPAWLKLSWVALAASTLVACSSTKNAADSAAEYRRSAELSRPLDVPPDLSQLPRDSRYQSASGIVSASSFQSGQVVAVGGLPTGTVAPNSLRGMKIERDTHQRWLSTPLSPEQVWPQLQAFWKDQGMSLETDNAELGIMETGWAENRAKLPQDMIRSLLGGLADRLYSTGERDQYRTRVERSASGTEIFISHKGLAEVYDGPNKDGTVWEKRPSEPGLEAEMLQRLLVRLGGKAEAPAVAGQTSTSGSPVAAAAATPARARLVSSEAGPSLQIDDGFDRAWRRVGLALDRKGFSVEDRDRGQGLYFVRYVDPALAGKEEPGFFASLFGRKDAVIGVSRYRLLIKSSGNSSTVRVQNAQGQPETGDAADHILKLLLDEVK